jgi:hypothetical protein
MFQVFNRECCSFTVNVGIYYIMIVIEPSIVARIVYIEAINVITGCENPMPSIMDVEDSDVSLIHLSFN